MEKEEIEELKRNWSIDPCWDIEDTEGFEDHKTELKLYRLECEALMDEAAGRKLQSEFKRLGTHSNQLVWTLQRMEAKITDLQNQIDQLKNQVV